MIGLAIASDELRAVLVSDDTVRWAGRAGRNDERPLAAQIVSLLAQAPSRRWARERVTAVVGPSAAQVKRLTGLPPVGSTSALALVVRENAGRFFLKNGVPLDVSDVRLVESGTAWATAFDAPVIEQIVAGCRSARRRLLAVAPAAVALAASYRNARILWRDGAMTAEIDIDGGLLVASRRVMDAGAATVEAALPPALARLGVDAWRFADAYGATILSRSEPLTVRPGARDGGSLPRRRIAMALAACSAAAAFGITAPSLWITFDAARAARAWSRVVPQAREAASTEQQLRRMTAALDEVATFEANRTAPTALLAALAQALPAGAMLVAVRLDSASGTLVMLAPRAARAVATLENVSLIATPELVGPVMREIVGTRELERATVRFRIVGKGSS